MSRCTHSIITIPVLWAGIVFFTLCCSLSSASELWLQLFEEGDWSGCRRECARILSQTPDNEDVLLFSALSDVRQPARAAAGVAALQKLSEKAEALHVRNLAAYELGRYMAATDEVEEAWPLLRGVFLSTHDRELFMRTGATMENLVWYHDGVPETDEQMQLQLRSGHPLWAGELQRSCRIEMQPGPSWGSRPGQWIVSFYRSQISPAIGARCSMLPSCSEYFRLASKKHGLLGVPILADRLVREPGVVNEAKDPVLDDHGHQRYRDPLESHDFWMEE